MTAANAGKLVPIEQSGRGGGGPAGPGGTGSAGRQGGFGAGTGIPGGTGTRGGTGTGTTTTTAKSTSLITGVAGATVVGIDGSRSGSATSVDIVTPTGLRETPRVPRAIRVTRQPLSTAAELTGTRQEAADDDDSDV